jgi:hypothetical protein
MVGNDGGQATSMKHSQGRHMTEGKVNRRLGTGVCAGLAGKETEYGAHFFLRRVLLKGLQAL